MEQNSLLIHIKEIKLPKSEAAILDLVKNKAEVRNTPIRSTDMTTNEVGLDQKEIKRFSFLRAATLANQQIVKARSCCF